MIDHCVRPPVEKSKTALFPGDLLILNTESPPFCDVMMMPSKVMIEPLASLSNSPGGIGNFEVAMIPICDSTDTIILFNSNKLL
jgi:hypothetical protein